MAFWQDGNGQWWADDESGNAVPITEETAKQLQSSLGMGGGDAGKQDIVLPGGYSQNVQGASNYGQQQMPQGGYTPDIVTPGAGSANAQSSVYAAPGSDPWRGYGGYTLGTKAVYDENGNVVLQADPTFVTDQSARYRSVAQGASDALSANATAQAAEGYQAGQALYNTANDARAVSGEYGNLIFGQGQKNASTITDVANTGAGNVQNYGTDAANKLALASSKHGVQILSQGLNNANELESRSDIRGATVSGAGAANAQGITGAATTGATRLGAVGNTQLMRGAAASGEAVGTARTLSGLEATEGPSAAQAQLRSATNEANQNALALARSARGWGQSASSLGQAQDIQARNLQEAGNQSVQLRAQENAQWRARQAANLGTAAQTLQNVGQTYSGLGSQMTQSAVNTRLTGATNAANLRQQAVLEGAQLGQQGDITGQTMKQQAASEGIQLAQAGQENAAQLGLGAVESATGTRLAGAQAAAGTEIGATTQAAGTAIGGIEAQGNLQQAAGNTVLAGLQGQGAGQVNSYNAAMAGEQAATGLQENQSTLTRQYASDEIQRYAVAKGITMQQAEMELQQQAAIIGGLSTAGAATITAISDVRAKENIEPASDSVLAAFMNVAPSAFDYKEPEKHGQGRFWGLMAQDLEKSEAGASVVEEHDGTKMLNLPKLNMLTAAGLGALANEVAELKRKVESRKRRSN